MASPLLRQPTNKIKDNEIINNVGVSLGGATSILALPASLVNTSINNDSGSYDGSGINTQIVKPQELLNNSSVVSDGGKVSIVGLPVASIDQSALRFGVSKKVLFDCKLPRGIKNIPSPLRRNAILKVLNTNAGTRFALDNAINMVDLFGHKVTAYDFSNETKIVLLTADDASYVKNIQPLCRYCMEKDYTLAIWLADTQAVYKIRKEAL